MSILDEPISTAVVTGAFGFVGRHVARYLGGLGIRVIGIGHGQWGRAEWRQWGLTAWHSSDITVAALATYAGRPDLIVHCAGSGSVAFSISQPLLDFDRTVNSTIAVLEFIRTLVPHSRLVLPSSASVYGRVKQHPIQIATDCHPVSPYGLHKLMAEQVCRSYGQHFGTRSAIVRLFSVYGIGLKKQLLWDACSKLSKGDSYFYGTGNETRDWIHVEDAAQLLYMVSMRAAADCFVVNGGSGQRTSIKDILDVLVANFSMSKVCFNGQVRLGDPSDYQADITEALELGWRPLHRWQDEVPEYVQWFQVSNG